MRWYEGMPEIERKFKVEALPEHLLGPGSAIQQGYLSVEPVEIRLRAQDGGHELTVKTLGGLRRVEVALPVAPEQFDELWPLATGFVSATAIPRGGRGGMGATLPRQGRGC